jgi:hypothetical protein
MLSVKYIFCKIVNNFKNGFFFTTNMRMCFNFKKHFGEDSWSMRKKYKFWCYLERIHLLFTTLRFVFFCRDHCICLFLEIFVMLLEHMFMFLLQFF